MNFGIPETSINMIIATLKKWVEIDKTIIFGSRAMGNHKNGSDIDLAIYGSEVTEEIINDVRVELNEELPLPYYFDIVHYEYLTHDELKEHIDTCGKLFYER